MIKTVSTWNFPNAQKWLSCSIPPNPNPQNAGRRRRKQNAGHALALGEMVVQKCSEDRAVSGFNPALPPSKNGWNKLCFRVQSCWARLVSLTKINLRRVSVYVWWVNSKMLICDEGKVERTPPIVQICTFSFGGSGRAIKDVSEDESVSYKLVLLCKTIWIQNMQDKSAILTWN